ncbi:hypothetical protein [Dyella sp.]|nr:hypothetical protein [Dyella sp.]HET7331618.1 hypothetical protein [Dyella sp.]
MLIRRADLAGKFNATDFTGAAEMTTNAGSAAQEACQATGSSQLF